MKPRAKVWDLIVESGLIRSTQVSEIRTQFEGDVGAEKRAKTSSILKWLRDQKRISEFQLKVLAGGLPGPFRYESYQIHAKEEGDSLDGSYRGVHVPSGHPVRLIFFGGDCESDAHQWSSIQRYARPLTEIHNRFIHRCFDVVEEGQFRFLVTEFCKGQSLNQKLPYKGRLPWPQTMQAAEQIGLALTEIHQSRLSHDRLWPGAVWLLPGGFCKVIWQVPWLTFDPQSSPETQQVPFAFQAPADQGNEPIDLKQRQRNDLYSFGAVLFRLLYGKPPQIKQLDPERRNQEIDKHFEALAKHEIPENFLQVIRLLLSADITNDLKDAEVATKLIGTILESQSTATDIDDPPESLPAFEDALKQKQRSSKFADRLESFNESESGDGPANQSNGVSSNSAVGGFDFAAIEPNASGVQVSARERVEKRRSSKKSNSRPMMIGGGILAVAVALGFLLSGVFSSPESDPNETDASQQADATDEEKNSPDDKSAKLGETTSPDEPEIAQVAYRPQNVVADDGEMLWQSPTGGEPLELHYMPAAPDVVLSFRPARLEANPQASKFIDSLGPRFGQLKQFVFSKLGVQPNEVDRLIVSLHPNKQNQYSPFVVLRLTEPADPDVIWKGMGSPASVKHSGIGDRDLFQLDSFEVFFNDDAEQIHTICFGPSELVRSSLESSGVVMADRSIQSLVDRSDGQRDVNLIFRNTSLLSEPGIWLFDGPFRSLRRTVHLFFDDRIQAAALSMHFEEGFYLELMTEQSQDFPADELVEWMPNKLSTTRNELNQYVVELAANPYWAAVQQRFDNMLNVLVRNTRTSIESRQVVSNCWLPESAAHNLLAASELVLNANSLGSGAGNESMTNAGPKTLQELLAIPRDLLVTTNPDLVNLLRDIEQEIRDDYPKLPFEFRIKLLGGDLAIEGITQNQRPGEVRAENESLEQILAKIMLQANPDKSATAPGDPNCKLIWVIGPDPDNPQNEIIMVTTRKAAAERKMTLPKVFQTE